MKPRWPSSLQWRLVGRLWMLQAALLTLLVLLIAAALWGTGLIIEDYEGGTLDVLTQAVEPAPRGGLALRPTAALGALRSEVPGLWFVIRDTRGHRLSEGVVPTEFAPLLDALEHLTQARLAYDVAGPHAQATRPDALVQWSDSAAGPVQLLTGTQGRMSAGRLVSGVSGAFLNIVLPILLLTGVATALATPIVVKRALAGLGDVALQAGRIDIEQRGVRLQAEQVPLEIRPLVSAVNDALGRLDEGYERHARFLADAAHELRTPIAILNTRLASLPGGAEKTRLLEDAARLSVLAGQLLDVQRLEPQRHRLAPVELVALARRVVVDLAPLAFAAGYEMSFEPEVEELAALGDAMSLERAVTNLVQNAIDHGGRRGTITVRVRRERCIEVSDEGAGVPLDGRERIFEPFHRLDAVSRGAGLGLNLVQTIMRLHDGHIAVVDQPSGGACFRMAFPAGPGVQDLTPL